MYGEFQKLETIILGISPDGETSHQNFIDKYDIPYKLLCDPQKKVMEKYGAFGEKKMYGKVTKGVIRSTVWVGPDGKVKKHWPKVVKAADHPAKVLETLTSDPG
jgi:peroxiredoxin Q/BCP